MPLPNKKEKGTNYKGPSQVQGDIKSNDDQGVANFCSLQGGNLD